MVMNDNDIRDRLQELNGWTYVDVDGHLKKTYKLQDFKASLDFVNAVGELAEEADHHPDIVIQYNNVSLSLRTHDEGGITEKDFQLAARIENLNM